MIAIGDIPAWQIIVPFVVLAISTVVSFYFYRKQQQRKSLTYSLNVTQLVNIHDEAQDDINVLYKGEQIERLHLVELTLENTGNVPIEKHDCYQPIVVQLGEGAKPLELEDYRPELRHLVTEITFEPTQVSLHLLLLNPKDSLTVSFLVSDLSQTPTLDYRIVGISQLKSAQEQAQVRSWRKYFLAFDGSLLSGLVVSTLALAIFGLLSWLPVFPDSHSENYSAVHLTRGGEYCADVLSTNDKHVVLQLAEGGYVRSLPLNEVVSIENNAC